MLCPEVWNFPQPKLISSHKQNLDWTEVMKTVNMNNFYKSVIVTCPDEINVPTDIEESVYIDREYYKVKGCALIEFLNYNFINNFVKRGKLYCLSVGKPCVTHNGVAIDPSGVLTLHVIEYVYQCLGLEGKKRPLGFYEVQVDLKNLTRISKLKDAFHKLDTFDILVSWMPHEPDICPSSIAKYFVERHCNVSAYSPVLTRRCPEVSTIPSLSDAHPLEVTEWIGMIIHEGDLYPQVDYVSDYHQSDGENPLKSNRIAILHSDSLYTPDTILNICECLKKYMQSRELPNYWVSLSVQSFTDSLWRWDYSRQSYFQSHDSSCTLFFSKTGITMYSIGEIKYK